MRGRPIGNVVAAPAPIGQPRRGRIRQPLPPGLPVLRKGHVGEDGVGSYGGQRVAVGGLARTGHHAEQAGLRVDRPQAPIAAQMHPGDILSHCVNAVAGVRGRRNQHGQIGLSTGRGKGRGDVVRLARGRFHAHDHHVLGQPALFACFPACQAQCVAFLAQEGISAIAGADALDRHLLWKVHDKAPLRAEIANGMQTLDERAAGLDLRQCRLSHAGHDVHVCRHIGAVG